MSLTKIKNKFFENHPNATAYIVYNEKLGKYICYTYNVAHGSAIGLDTKKIAKIMKSLNLDCASATLYYINEKHPNLSEVFSDFYFDWCITKEMKFENIEDFCTTFYNYMERNYLEKNDTTSRPKIYAYILDDNGEIKETIFDMEITIKTNANGSRTCIIENTFTENDYKCAGIHGMGIKFLEAVLAEKNIHIIKGKSQECDVYESSNGSTLVEHYKKLGFEVDFQEDGSYTITKYVNPEQVIDISKPDNIITR